MNDNQKSPVDLADVPTGLVPVYEDKNGNMFFGFTKDSEMTYKRFFAANLQEKFLRFGLTESFLEKALDLGIAIAFDKSRTEQQIRQDSATVFQNIKMRLGQMVSEEPWLNLASVFFVLGDEPVDEYREDWAKKKKEMWEADPDAKDFFLQKAFEVSRIYVNMSPEDIKTCLQIAEERENNIPTLPAI